MLRGYYAMLTAAMNTSHPPGAWNTAPLWPRQKRCRQAGSSTKDHSAEQAGPGFGHHVRQERTKSSLQSQYRGADAPEDRRACRCYVQREIMRGRRSRWPVDGSGWAESDGHWGLHICCDEMSRPACQLKGAEAMGVGSWSPALQLRPVNQAEVIHNVIL